MVNIEVLEDVGHATRCRFLNSDPHMFMPLPSGGRWDAGWHLFSARLTVHAGSIKSGCLYVDYGDGFSEATRIDLPAFSADGKLEMLCVFPRAAVGVRYDPSICDAEVTLHVPALYPVSRVKAFLQMVRYLRSDDAAILTSLREQLGMVMRGASSGSLRAFGDELYRRYRDKRMSTGMSYADWVAAHALPEPKALTGPLVSVIMPTCNTPKLFLEEVIDSIRSQTYASWELCVCDDASDDADVPAYLSRCALSDSRIKVLRRPSRGGISSATNDAIEASSGKYLAFVDHDDLLHPRALELLVHSLEAGSADVAYSDHDYIDPDGTRCDPFFKPGWSPDLFLAQMYLAHLVLIRRELVRAVGRLDSNCDGAQDYDLVLRCIAEGAAVVHVPEVLYHWRRHAGSTAANPGSKPYAHLAGQRALQRYVDRRYPGSRVDESSWLFCYDVRYPIPNADVLASIIIPTRDGLDLLKACIKSITELSICQAFEVIIVDNGSREAETLEWLDQLGRNDSRFRVLRADEPFNWSRLNNRGAAIAKGEVLVFLNNDTEVITRDWLERLVETACRDDVAACGPLLLYADRTIQHAGVVVGMGGWADHVFKGMDASHMQRFFVSPMMRRNVAAVTGACVAIQSTKFRELGGFDESFLVCGSDVEICLRGLSRGLLTVYLPEVRLLHLESKTRDPKAVPDNDFQRSAEAYGEYRTVGDPYFNPNLDIQKTTPSLGGLL